METRIPDGIVLRLVHLPDVDVGAASLLDPVELHRAEGYASPDQRRSFLAGRIALRRFAAELLGVPESLLELDYRCGNCRRTGRIDHGRPGYRAPAGERPALSLSRSGPWCLMAGSTIPTVESIGVDLERIAGADFVGFDDVVLTFAERGRLAAAPAPDRPVLRARLWARKEAFLKAEGTGLLQDPSSVDAAADRVGRTALFDLDGIGLDLVDLDGVEAGGLLTGLPEGYVAALAVTG